MPGQVLDVLQRHVLGKQIRDDQDPERVGEENLRQAGRTQPSLEYPLHRVRRHMPISERTPTPPCPKQRRSHRRLPESGPFDPGLDPHVQVVTHRDIPHLASLLGKLQRPVVALVPQVLDPEPAKRPDADTDKNERPEDRPVAQPEHMIRVDGDLGSPLLAEQISDPAVRPKGIEHRRVARDERVEELAQTGWGLVPGGRVTGSFSMNLSAWPGVTAFISRASSSPQRGTDRRPERR